MNIPLTEPPEANAKLAREALVHSISSVAPRAVIVGSDLASRLAAVRARLESDLSCWVYGDGTQDLAPLAPALTRLSGDELRDSEYMPPQLDATALYIYTSGTTGLPKAAKDSHYRVIQWSHWFPAFIDPPSPNPMFNCLPLYHSVGGVVATGATLVSGGAVVIRARFSASDFWRDVRDERCPLFQYIGA